MKTVICMTLALLASPAFATGSSAGTGESGNGVVLTGTANQTIGNRTITVNVNNMGSNSIKAPKTNNAAGTSSGTFSAGLSIGATLGNGFGSSSGIAGTQSGL